MFTAGFYFYSWPALLISHCHCVFISDILMPPSWHRLATQIWERMGVQTEAPPSARERRSSPQVNVLIVAEVKYWGKLFAYTYEKLVHTLWLPSFDLIFCQSKRATFFNYCCKKSSLSPCFRGNLDLTFWVGELLFAVKNKDYSFSFSQSSQVFCFAKLKIIQQNPELLSFRILNTSSEILFDNARQSLNSEKSRTLFLNVTEVASQK